MRKVLVLCVLLLCTMMTFSQSKSPDKTKINQENTQLLKLKENSKVVQSTEFKGRPVFIDTGNLKQDSLDYYTLKAEWILKNPDAYKSIIERKTNPSNK